MAEDATKITGGEIPNGGDKAGAQEEGAEAKTTFTLEEVEAIKKKMQSDSEKGVQKVISEKKLYETAFKESQKIVNSAEYLIDLFEDKPEVAQAILDNFYNGQSIEDYKKSIGYEEDLSDPAKINKLVDKRAQELERTRLIEKSKQDFISKLKMTPEETEKFEEAFDERKGLKSFSLENLEKNLEKAFREISDNPEQLKALKDQELIAKSLATGEGGSGSEGKETKKDTLSSEISSFLDKYS